jgi:hypothetical protein
MNFCFSMMKSIDFDLFLYSLSFFVSIRLFDKVCGSLGTAKLLVTMLFSQACLIHLRVALLIEPFDFAVTW